MTASKQHTRLLQERLNTALNKAGEALKELNYALLYVAALEPDLPADIQETVHRMRKELSTQVRRVEGFFEMRH